MKSKGRTYLKTVIYFIIVIIILWIGKSIYLKYNYYYYTKGIREKDKTSFTRDSDIVYSDMDSYKINNYDFNDAMFYKTIPVKPNTAYKVTCMVKTENIETKEEKYTTGAQISINNTTECSEAITGTNDWTKLTLMFNSNNRKSVEIGFRLGGNEGYCKGIAWFSDFKIEQGIIDKDKNWNMACFIIENIDFKIQNGSTLKNVKLSMSYDDVKTIKSNMRRLQETIEELSGNKMSITYDIIEIEEALTTISYDYENEYYVGPEDANPLIKDFIDREEYDYIYLAVRLGDLNESSEVLVHDWIGLRFNGI